MLSEQEKNAYWALVNRCLIEFHAYSSADSAKAVYYFRSTLERKVSGSEAADFIYHEEPFELACRLSGQALDLNDHFERYDALVEEIDQQEHSTPIEVLPGYSQSDLDQLFQQVFALYYQSEVRICDVRRSPDLNRELYDRVLSSVVRTGADPETNSPFFSAPSPVEAAIFLMDQQCRTGFIESAPSKTIGETFQIKAFKLVFRAQTADRLDFQPFLWSLKDLEQRHHNRVLAAFCFLLKAVTEHNVPSVSLQAFLGQTVAFQTGILTDLLDWTSDPAIAILYAMSGKEPDDLSTVFFSQYENLQNVLLPPPFVSSHFRQRRFFSAMNSRNNSELFHWSSRISFPATKTFKIPASYPLFEDNIPKHFDELPVELAKLADKLAKTFATDLDALDSKDPAKRAVSVARLMESLSGNVTQLASKYQFSRQVWDSLARNWILEAHRYFNDLLLFQTPDELSYVATESLWKLVHLNRDALNLYSKYMLSHTGKIFEQKRPYFEQLQQHLQAEHPELHRRDLEFEAPKKVVALDVELPEFLREERPELHYEEVTPSQRIAAMAEDLVLV